METFNEPLYTEDQHVEHTCAFADELNEREVERSSIRMLLSAIVFPLKIFR